MIFPSLHTIAEQLNTHIYEKWGATINGTTEIAQLNNIVNINDEKSDLQNKIILTLIKVEEETSLKNNVFYTKTSSLEKKKHNPAIYLNLYLLVSITKKNYSEALQLLSDTIIFFQGHSVFTGQIPGSIPGEETQFKLTVELFNTNFQEVFDMWSNLGSKQFPSVVYKVRVLQFFDTQEYMEVPTIQKVKLYVDKEPGAVGSDQ